MIPEFPVQFMLKVSGTFLQLATLIHCTEFPCQGVRGRLTDRLRSECRDRAAKFAIRRGGKSVLTVFRISI